MKFRRFNIVLMAGIVILVFAGSALSDYAKRSGSPRPRMMLRVFEEADCPLDEFQIEQIRNLERGPESRRAFLDILNTDQKEALENVQERRGGKVPRRRMMAHLFKEADCPLDEFQIEQIKNLERGPESRRAFLDILNAEQKEALKNAPRGRIGAAVRRRGIAGILENAGCPLSEDQLKDIRDLKPGLSRRSEIESIITPEQKSALENFFGSSLSEELEKPTGVEEQPESLNILKQNYPNPFNPTTTIEYQLAKPGYVKVEVYGPNGQFVSSLVDGHQERGWHSVVWDVSSHATGVYICRITSGDFSQTQKMTLVK